MRTFFYYDRGYLRKPMITHCLVTDGDKWARGTAVCSFHDNPCKKTGRAIAKSRALAALQKEMDLPSGEPHGRHSHPYVPGFLRASFQPSELSEREKKMLRRDYAAHYTIIALPEIMIGCGSKM